MLILAWSSVSFNLPQVYRPVMALIGTEAEPPAPPTRDPATPPQLDWRAAHRRAQALMADAAGREGFKVISERLLFYDPATHVYAYRILSDRDPGVTGNTQIRFDGDTGAALSLELPTGRATGTTITTWIGDLHVGDVFGWPMKVALTLAGVATALLSLTGVLIWLRKAARITTVAGPRCRHGMSVQREPTGSEAALEFARRPLGSDQPGRTRSASMVAAKAYMSALSRSVWSRVIALAL